MKNVITGAVRGRPSELLKVLGKREQEVAKCVSWGLMDKEIAAYLGMSERTVRSHIWRLFVELELRNRVELTRWLLAHPGALDGEACPPGNVVGAEFHEKLKAPAFD